MLIPYQMLEPATLDALLEDFVTRDGTDNGFDDSLERR
ncbi:MAG TPA: YheU family protein, partial [Pseudomonas pachastrellae]|nr:YheU family protein [Halopseudomonas pachastrellae]